MISEHEELKEYKILYKDKENSWKSVGENDKDIECREKCPSLHFHLFPRDIGN